jgi:hypothetical protein
MNVFLDDLLFSFTTPKTQNRKAMINLEKFKNYKKTFYLISLKCHFVGIVG